MLRAARKRKIHVGLEDNGRRMTLDDFDHASVEEGYLYELGKGVIEVSEVPNPKHLAQVQELRDQLTSYKLSNPGVIHTIAGPGEAKLLIGPSDSERHPDIVVYFSAPPEVDTWSLWVPKIVVEVVSARSAKRDYEEKPQEYLEFGVDEYWIVDSIKQQMKVHIRWRGQWKEKIVKPNGSKYSTRHLPGFALDLKRVLNAAK